MEGKGVLFKKVAGIDVFDIETIMKKIQKSYPDLSNSLEPTFWWNHLEDIKPPEMFRNRNSP